MTKLKAFEKVKDQIGACGIWCGSCVVGNGVLRLLTRNYKNILKNYGVDHWGPKDIDYKKLFEYFESIQRIPLCPGCWEGGGREECEIRNCTVEKKINDCIECRVAKKGCKHIKLLKHMQDGALKAGLLVKTAKPGKQKSINQGTKAPRHKVR